MLWRLPHLSVLMCECAKASTILGHALIMQCMHPASSSMQSLGLPRVRTNPTCPQRGMVLAHSTL